MKKGNPKDSPDFFLELPTTDYLVDIEIQDEYEILRDPTLGGLSEEQVAQLAIDLLSTLPAPDQPPVQD